MRCLVWCCLIAFAAIGPVGIASGDDAAIEGVGGSIKAMDEHPSVVMESERVAIELRPDRGVVECTFVFCNTGKATNVRMGFPEQASGEVAVQHPSGFTSFATWVDARPVATRIEGLQRETGDPTGWKRSRVKTVQFAAGQTRRVRVRYTAPVGVNSVGERSFHYLIRTGRSWKGTVGHALVIMRLRDFPAAWDISAAGERRGDEYVWEKRDFEPTAQDDIHVSWFPGYKGIRVNGGRADVEARRPYPVLKDGVVWAAVRAVADWLDHGLPPESLERTRLRTKGKIVELRRRDRVVRLAIGSVTMEANGRQVTLPGAPYLRGGRMVVPLAPVARALGARVWFDPKTKTTHIETTTANPRSE